MIYIFLSNIPPSGDINSSNLSFFMIYKNYFSFLPLLCLRRRLVDPDENFWTPPPPEIAFILSDSQCQCYQRGIILYYVIYI